MRIHTTTILALGATLAATALAATPAAAFDRYEDGTRISGARLNDANLLHRAQSVGMTKRDARTVADRASPEPATAVAPCPGGVGNGGGVYLNGTSPNGWQLNGWTLNSPGLVLQGRSPTGGAVAARTGAQRVTAVRLPDGRALAVRQR